MEKPGKEHKGIHWGAGNVLDLGDLGSDTSIYICKMPSSCTLKFVHLRFVHFTHLTCVCVCVCNSQLTNYKLENFKIIKKQLTVGVHRVMASSFGWAAETKPVWTTPGLYLLEKQTSWSKKVNTVLSRSLQYIPMPFHGWLVPPFSLSKCSFQTSFPNFFSYGPGV